MASCLGHLFKKVFILMGEITRVWVQTRKNWEVRVRGCHINLPCSSFSTVCLQSFMSLQKQLPCSLQAAEAQIMGFQVTCGESTECEHSPQTAVGTEDPDMAPGSSTGLDITMALGCSIDCGHPHGLQWLTWAVGINTVCAVTWNHVDVYGPAAAAGDHTDLRGLHCHQRSWWWSWVMSRLVVLSRTMLRSVVLLQNFYFKTFLFFVNHVSYASGKSLNIQNVFFALWFPWVCMAPVRLSVFVISLKILGHT